MCLLFVRLFVYLFLNQFFYQLKGINFIEEELRFELENMGIDRIEEITEFIRGNRERSISGVKEIYKFLRVIRKPGRKREETINSSNFFCKN